MPDAQTKPRFLDSFNELLDNLRLGGLKALDQADDRRLVEQSLQRAQAQMVAHLGFDRLTELEAIPYVPNPTNETQQERAFARLVEIELTRSFAIERIRLRFLADTSGLRQDWQHAPGLQDISLEQLSKIQADARSAAKEALAYLEGSISLEDTAGEDAGLAQTFGHEQRTGYQTPHPGSTVFGARGKSPPPGYGAASFDDIPAISPLTTVSDPVDPTTLPWPLF